MTEGTARSIALAGFMVALGIVLTLVAPHFLNPGNLRDIGLNATHIAIAGLGMLLVIAIGQIDVSIGAIFAIAATVAGTAAKDGASASWIVLLSVAVGVALGTINGLGVILFRVHSIVVTLGMLSIYRGALIYFTGGSWIYDLPPQFDAIGKGDFFGVPNPIVAVVVLFPLAAFLLKNSVLGRSIFAVGSNTDAARLAGINIPLVQISAFAVNGGLVGLAAILHASRFSIVQSNTGVGFELTVITAVVVGGASIFGGSGSPLGLLLGSLLISMTATAMVFLGIDSFWEQAVLGFFILLAVLTDRAKSFWQPSRTARRS